MARVSDEQRAPDDYRWARQVSALLLIAVVMVIMLLDVSVDGYEGERHRSSWIDRQLRGRAWVRAVIRRLPR